MLFLSLLVGLGLLAACEGPPFWTFKLNPNYVQPNFPASEADCAADSSPSPCAAWGPNRTEIVNVGSLGVSDRSAMISAMEDWNSLTAGGVSPKFSAVFSGSADYVATRDPLLTHCASTDWSYFPNQSPGLLNPKATATLTGVGQLKLGIASCSILHTSRHELGHVLGLGHANYSAQIMYDGTGSSPTAINSNDVQGVRCYYDNQCGI